MMHPRFKSSMLRTALFILILTLILDSSSALAELDAPEISQSPGSVYEASMTAAETVKVKTLSIKEFSKYAAQICEKYGLNGPREVKSLAQRDVLFKNLTSVRKDKFKLLCDQVIRENSLAKGKVEADLRALTQEIQQFPNLKFDGYDENYSQSTFKDLQPPAQIKDVSQSDLHKRLRSVPNHKVYDPIKPTEDEIEKQYGKNYIK